VHRHVQRIGAHVLVVALVGEVHVELLARGRGGLPDQLGVRADFEQALGPVGT
jgi:hypothetical protein